MVTSERKYLTKKKYLAAITKYNFTRIGDYNTWMKYQLLYSCRMAILFQPKYCIKESLTLLNAWVDGTFVNNPEYFEDWNSTLLGP
jgi:hypothetical protein